MRVLFYAGAMFFLIGMGVAYMGYRLEGALVMCFSVAAIAIGFMGLKFNVKVDSIIKNNRK